MRTIYRAAGEARKIWGTILIGGNGSRLPLGLKRCGKTARSRIRRLALSGGHRPPLQRNRDAGLLRLTTEGRTSDRRIKFRISVFCYFRPLFV